MSMYHLICVREGDEWKTAFRTPFGLFESNVMNFGFSNALGIFQCFMNSVLHEALDIFVVVYIDDIFIFSKDLKTHHEHVQWVMLEGEGG